MAIPRTDQEILLDNLTKAIQSLDTGTKQANQTDKTGKVEDTLHVSGDVGMYVLAVRNDAADCSADDGDYVSLQVNHDGYLYTQTSSTHAEDAAHANGDKGVMSLVVRKDVAACLAHDGDYQPFQCDTDGTVRTQNTFGTWGTILVNDTTTVTCAVSGRDFVAIYMLTDTVFSSSANGLSSTTANLYLDDTNVSTDVSSAGGTAIDGVTFPAGMTLYGRYTGFTLASGSVIAYVG